MMRNSSYLPLPKLDGTIGMVVPLYYFEIGQLRYFFICGMESIWVKKCCSIRVLNRVVASCCDSASDVGANWSLIGS
jgi:hypothetical protein